MPNQIRPSSRYFVHGTPIVLDILIERPVSAFTWVIARHPFESDRHIAAQGWRPKTGTRRPTASSSVTVASELAEGDYVARLFAGKPHDSDVASFLSSAQLLDEDTFTVTGSSIEAAVSGALGSSATFVHFGQYLARSELDKDDQDGWPVLGATSYQALLDAAREFVGRTVVSESEGLIPAEYASGVPDESRHLPKLVGLPADPNRAPVPAVELIWNYWLEEGMLVQTLDAIVARFENIRRPGPDPLARFDITPLLPLRVRLTAYAADEMNRTTVRRRSAEYEYEYGFSLVGRATHRMAARSERESRFTQSFHRVLLTAHRYLRDRDDLTIQANAFDLYLALRDCHLVLAEKGYDQQPQKVISARAEFLVMQSLLAEPQMREFLGSRPFDAHPEPWMNRVDSMARLEGWPDTGVIHFNDLAVCGEQLILTIRRCSWADPGVDDHDAANWALIFRAAIHRYVAAYHAVTGRNLAQDHLPELAFEVAPCSEGAAGDDGERAANQHARVLRAIAADIEAAADPDC